MDATIHLCLSNIEFKQHLSLNRPKTVPKFGETFKTSQNWGFGAQIQDEKDNKPCPNGI